MVVLSVELKLIYVYQNLKQCVKVMVFRKI